VKTSVDIDGFDQIVAPGTFVTLGAQQKVKARPSHAASLLNQPLSLVGMASSLAAQPPSERIGA
jgi:hypothetical protein